MDGASRACGGSAHWSVGHRPRQRRVALVGRGQGDHPARAPRMLRAQPVGCARKTACTSSMGVPRAATWCIIASDGNRFMQQEARGYWALHGSPRGRPRTPTSKQPRGGQGDRTSHIILSLGGSPGSAQATWQAPHAIPSLAGAARLAPGRLPGGSQGRGASHAGSWQGHSGPLMS